MAAHEILQETNFTDLGALYRGKVRDFYTPDGASEGILISTDRHSSFNRNIAHIPFKGGVLNLLCAWWFSRLRDTIANHFISIPDPNAMVVQVGKRIHIEAVVRGYLTGSTSTSIWTRYQAGQRVFGGVMLPDGWKKNRKLPRYVFDPTTKGDSDDPISSEQIVAQGIVTRERLGDIRDASLALFRLGQEIAAERNLILVDTKYEFALDEYGDLFLIDEVHTPDSSRYWTLDTYEARLASGEEPESFDKESLRLWIKQRCDPYQDPIPPIPEELIDNLSQSYISLYQQLTGTPFRPGETPIIPRLEKNLAPYRIAA